MNELVIDASCILEFLLNQDNKDYIVAKVSNSKLVAPDCMGFEIGNAITKLIKRGLISIYEGVSVFHEYARIPIRFIEPEIPSAILIAGENKSYAYDAYYINVAEQMSLPLFTLDEQMQQIAVGRGIKCL